jgi:hypothetical protein
MRALKPVLNIVTSAKAIKVTSSRFSHIDFGWPLELLNCFIKLFAVHILYQYEC